MHLRNYSYIHKLSFKISKFYQICEEQSQLMNDLPWLVSMRVITLLLWSHFSDGFMGFHASANQPSKSYGCPALIEANMDELRASPSKAL